METKDIDHLLTSGCSECQDIALREIKLSVEIPGYAVRGDKNPNWTVGYNIVSKPNTWVGTGWEFFDKESDAQACYDHQIKIGNNPFKRPYHPPIDWYHLGAVHTI